MVSPQTRQHPAGHYSVKHLSSIPHIILSILKHPSITHLILPYPTLSYLPAMGHAHGNGMIGTWEGLAAAGLGLSSIPCSTRRMSRTNEGWGDKNDKGSFLTPLVALWVYIFCSWHSSVGLHMPTAPLLQQLPVAASTLVKCQPQASASPTSLQSNLSLFAHQGNWWEVMQKKDTSFAHLELQCIHLLGIHHNHNRCTCKSIGFADSIWSPTNNQCDICTWPFH